VFVCVCVWLALAEFSEKKECIRPAEYIPISFVFLLKRHIIKHIQIVLSHKRLEIGRKNVVCVCVGPLKRKLEFVETANILLLRSSIVAGPSFVVKFSSSSRDNDDEFLIFRESISIHQTTIGNLYMLIPAQNCFAKSRRDERHRRVNKRRLNDRRKNQPTNERTNESEL